MDFDDFLIKVSIIALGVFLGLCLFTFALLLLIKNTSINLGVFV